MAAAHAKTVLLLHPDHDEAAEVHKTATLLALQSCRSHPSTQLGRQRVIVQVGAAGRGAGGGAARRWGWGGGACLWHRWPPTPHAAPPAPRCPRPPPARPQNPDTPAPGRASEAEAANHSVARVAQRSLPRSANMKVRCAHAAPPPWPVLLPQLWAWAPRVGWLQLVLGQRCLPPT